MKGSHHLEALREVNAFAAFNRWADFRVTEADDGEVALEMVWREEFGQYAGYLHAGMIGALTETVCGYAAYTQSGPGLTSHFSVNCLAPAIGERFLARGRVIKAGRKQIFAAAHLFAVSGDNPKLVATAEAILVPVPAGT